MKSGIYFNIDDDINEDGDVRWTHPLNTPTNPFTEATPPNTPLEPTHWPSHWTQLNWSVTNSIQYNSSMRLLTFSK